MSSSAVTPDGALRRFVSAAAWASRWRSNMSDAIGEILWQPSEARIAGTALARFAKEQGIAPTDYGALLRWSINEPEIFYGALWDFLGVIGDKGGRSFAAGAEMRADRFFPYARLNYAENILRDPDDRLAIIAHR